MSLTPGTRLGPYQIVSLLGAGGMGEVYKARDPRLGRDVAIKVLHESVAADPERLRRFEQEARAVAALSHPNILAIFDVGAGAQPYLVTELLEGETLREGLARGPLSLPRTTEVALQFVAGLAAAHDRGIVHRDLKPENIFLTRDRGVKILDFGLAKATSPAEAGPHDASGRGVRLQADVDLTRAGATLAGLVMGTAGYMSPEQVRGQAADPRSDIFAAGAILYEMVTGQRAFQGTSPADTMSAVLREQPVDLVLRSGTPPALARLVRRCLEKDANDRFQSARDLRFAIESISDAHPAAPAPAKKADEKSVAVLPFANMSADADNQYFSDGLAEELINALTRLPGLHVASRTSAFRFRGGDVDIREIGRQLHVTTVLEGSVRRSGTRLRVTAQLINIADGYHIWSERYDREMADVFAIQDEIVEAIVTALAPALVGDAKKAVRRPTENLEAYELYLKGRHSWHMRSPAAMQSAVRCFEQVIRLDPEYALAHAGLADCFGVCRGYGWFSAAQSHERAREAVTRAIALDPSLAEVNFSQASYIFWFERNWRDAEAPLRRAIAINPRMAAAHGYLALWYACDGDVEGATSHAELERNVDPLSAFSQYLAGITYSVAGRFEPAERIARYTLELQPDSLTGLWPLGLALSGSGRDAEAVTVVERAAMLSRAPFYVGQLGFTYARVGRVDDARRLLIELEDRAGRGEYVSPAAPLFVAAGLGDVAAVRRGLEACVADATPLLTIKVTSGSFLTPYRADADVARLMDTLQAGPWPTR